MVAVGELRDQIPEHVGRGREAVQEQHDRGAGWAGFAIEDLDAVDRFGPVMGHDRRLVAGRGVRRERGPRTGSRSDQ